MTPTIKDIQIAVAAHYNLPLSIMKSHDVKRHIARPRMVSMYLSREITGRSWKSIGESHSKDHTTAMNAHYQIGRTATTSEKLIAAIGQIRANLQDPSQFWKSKVALEFAPQDPQSPGPGAV